MTILNLMLGRGRGGIEQAAIDYAEALLHAGIGHITLTQPDAAINDTLDAHHLPRLLLRSFAAWDPIAPYMLRKLAIRENATAIIAHGNRALTTALRTASGYIPVIAVAHNYKLKRFPKADAAFAISRDLERRLQDMGLGRIFHMPNMARLSNAPERTGFRKPPVIGSMGRFVQKKGFEVLIDAVGLLTIRGINCRCIIAGDGELREEYQAKINRIQMQSRITLQPWVTNKDAFFQSLDLFILPSHHEPFGIVLLEAQARGVPVISTMSEGPREIIEQDVTGRLSPLGSAELLADSIEHALTNPQQALNWATNAREKLARDYSLDALAHRLREALSAIPAK